MSWSGGSTAMRPLVSGADAKDLGEVVEILNANQIPYEYNEAGDSILVPEDKRASMRMELAMKGLPKTGDVGFEIFDEGNFGISDFVQRTNHTRAIQGELARTISMMDAIRSSKVFVVCLQIVSLKISIINLFTAVVDKNLTNIGFKILYITLCSFTNIL